MVFSIGLPGRVTISFTMAGVVAWGGILPTTLTLANGISGSTTLAFVLTFSAVGFVLGFAHGAVLGYVGRPRGATRHDVLHELLAVIPWLPLAALGALFASVCVPLSMVLPSARGWLAAVPCLLGWIVAIGVLGWAVTEARRALRLALERWPESRLGSAILVLAFAALLTWFGFVTPQVGGATFTPFGAFALAGALTLWLIAPVAIVTLHFIHTRLFPRMAARHW